jgi:hypothetical protein
MTPEERTRLFGDAHDLQAATRLQLLSMLRDVAGDAYRKGQKDMRESARAFLKGNGQPGYAIEIDALEIKDMDE